MKIKGLSFLVASAILLSGCAPLASESETTENRREFTAIIHRWEVIAHGWKIIALGEQKLLSKVAKDLESSKEKPKEKKHATAPFGSIGQSS